MMILEEETGFLQWEMTEERIPKDEENMQILQKIRY